MAPDPAKRDALIARLLLAGAFVQLMAGAALLASGQVLFGRVLLVAALLDGAIGFVFLRRASRARQARPRRQRRADAALEPKSPRAGGKRQSTA